MNVSFNEELKEPLEGGTPTPTTPVSFNEELKAYNVSYQLISFIRVSFNEELKDYLTVLGKYLTPNTYPLMRNWKVNTSSMHARVLRVSFNEELKALSD